MNTSGVKCTIMRDLINEDMIRASVAIEDITEKIFEYTDNDEDPPKELLVLLNEYQALLDALVGMREAGM